MNPPHNPRDDFESKIQDSARKRSAVDWIRSQFVVPPIGAHQHNGQDAIQIQYSNLKGRELVRVVERITLSPTEVLSLYHSEVTILTPPAAGTVYVVDAITAYLDYKSAAYSTTNTTYFEYLLDGSRTGTTVVANMPSSFLTATNKTWLHLPAVTAAFNPVPGGSGTDGAVVMYMGGSNATSGNSPITLWVAYRLIAF